MFPSLSSPLRVILTLVLLLSGLGLHAQVKDWTVLVYVMADNNLEASAMDDLTEMTKAKVGVNSTIVAQVTATGANYDLPTVVNLKRITTTQRLEARPGSLKVLSDLGKTNSADPQSLSSFIKWGIKTYPAQHFALILWDHGGSWPGYGSDDSHDGAGFDLATLKSALGAGLKDSSVKTFDLVGFDACLMATYEVARSLRPLAQYLLASEELEPGHGWDYAALSVLAKNPDAETLGKTLIKGFADQAVTEGDRDSITLSLLNLQKMDPLDKSVADFTAWSRSKIGQIAAQLGRIKTKAQGYGKASKPEEDTNMIDLGNFVSLYAQQDPAAAALKKQMDAALAQVVVDRVSGKLTEGSTGVSVYFPNQKRYFDEAYNQIDSGSWKDLLADYYRGGSTLAPKSTTPATTPHPSPAATDNYVLAFTNKDNLGRVTIEDGGSVTMTGSLPKKTISKVVEGTFSYGIKDGDDYVFLGDSEVFLDDKTGEVSGTWDLQVLKLKQGKKEAYGFSSESEQEGDKWESSIPLRYYEKGKVVGEGEAISLVLTTDAEGTILNEEYFTTTNDKWGAFKRRKGSVVVPTWEVVTSDGESTEEPTTELSFDPNKDLEYDYEAIDPQSTPVYLELTVYDVGDNSDFVSYEGSL